MLSRDRELFVESFWWILHELSGFNIELRAEDVVSLESACVLAGAEHLVSTDTHKFMVRQYYLLILGNF